MRQLSDYIYDSHLFWGHTSNNQKEELLEAHLRDCMVFYREICKLNQLDGCVARIVEDLEYSRIDEVLRAPVVYPLSEKTKVFVKHLFEDLIYLHDLGKATPSFQLDIMKNIQFLQYEIIDSKHSLLSSLLILDILDEEIKALELTESEHDLLRHLVLEMTYVVSRHHGYLEGTPEYIKKLECCHSSLIENESDISFYRFKDRLLKYSFKTRFASYGKSSGRNTQITNPQIYMLCKLLFSTLVACDFYATNAYMSNGNRKIELKYVLSTPDFYKSFNKSDVVQKNRKQTFLPKILEEKVASASHINDLRTQMFLEAEHTLKTVNADKNNDVPYIYYLEAPTGSGKTISSINLSYQLVKLFPELNKLFYVFPFNTLSEQTHSVLEKYFASESISLINSITPIKCTPQGQSKGQLNKMDSENYSSEDYIKAHLEYLFLHDPIILTSHVRFLEYLTGVGREASVPLVHLVNSVVILDEIQAYPNQLWMEIITHIEICAKYFNMRFIIMSATLPKLSQLQIKETSGALEKYQRLLSKGGHYVDLIQSPELYFSSAFFKDRVKANFELMDKPFKEPQEIAKSVLSRAREHQAGRILIEFIRKKDARSFFKYLTANQSLLGLESTICYELSGDDNALYRKQVINEIIRTNSKTGEYVLKNVILVATQVIEAGVDIDMEIGFKDYSLLDSDEQFCGRINRSCLKRDAWVYFFDYASVASIYKEDLRVNLTLKSSKVQDYFALKQFGSYYEELFQKHLQVKLSGTKLGFGAYAHAMSTLNYQDVHRILKLIQNTFYQIYLPGCLKTTSSDQKALPVMYDGEQLWKDYQTLLGDFSMPYAKKQIELSRLKAQMAYFTFNVSKLPITVQPEKNVLHYIENGSKYLIEGKFDRAAYEADCKKESSEVFW